MLRESGVVRLPLQRRLRDHTYYAETKYGFSDLQTVEMAKLVIIVKRRINT